MNIRVVLPAYNEEKSIATVINEIRDMPIATDILVANNNSKDRTAVIAHTMGVKVIDVPQQGKGNAVREALKHAEGYDFTFMLDADYTYPAFYIMSMLPLLQYHYYDAVVGVRGRLDGDSMPMLHIIGNVGLSILASLLYKHNIYDLCSGMWGFSKYTIQKLNLASEGFTLEADIVTNILTRNLKLGQVEISYRKRIGDSKLKIVDGLKIAQFLAKRRCKLCQ